MIRMIVEAGRRAGIRVAMCGEMAGEPAYALILLGLEIDELSMNPMAIPRVKKIIRSSTCEEAKRLLEAVMKLSSAAEIEDHVRRYMASRFPENGVGERERECVAEEK
jgi:phosphotransferase system enzyme I (PtsI)